MKKGFVVCIILLLFNCKSVDNWSEEPVLLVDTVKLAAEYVFEQTTFLDLYKTRSKLDIRENLSLDQLDELLLLEKKLVLKSQSVSNSWFDFYLQLRQDPGYTDAFKGHYYFRKGIEALEFSGKIIREDRDNTLKDSKLFDEIILLEGECRLAIGEIVSKNSSYIDTEVLYKELKQIYKTMD